MYGVVVLDVSGVVLCFVILWNDICSYVEVVELDVMFDLCCILGNIVFLGFIVLKLVWMVWYEFDLFSCVVMVLLFKDYLCLWLIGECVSEMLDVLGISWLDVVVCDWFDVVLVVGGMRCD